jgi:hypothetical protein
VRVFRYLLLPLVLILSLCTATSANAESKVADCLELKFPSATATSTVFTLTVKVYATCTEEQIGRGKGQRAVFSMPQEDSLLTLGSCSGPTAQPRVGLSDGLLGTATCSLRVGSNTLPSLRVGATSTTIRMWFSWDFSEQSVSVPHTAIPGSTSNGGGGSSSGSSGSSPGLSVPAVKNCTSAPDTPTLSITWNEKGPLFKFSPASIGEKATALFWNFTFYDSEEFKWDTWSPWKSISPAASGEYQALPVLNKSKIAFAVYGLNVCGSSSSAREIDSNIGVPLNVRIQDEIVNIFPISKRVTIGDKVSISNVVSSKLKLSILGNSLTPTICRITNVTVIETLDIGECKIAFVSVSSLNKEGVSRMDVPLVVKAPLVNQSIPVIKISSSYDISVSQVELKGKSNVGLSIQFSSLNEKVCSVQGEFLVFNSKGICTLRLRQEGSDEFLPADDAFISTLVKDQNRVITCTKGKLTKKLTGLNPKCPVGYKVKK